MKFEKSNYFKAFKLLTKRLREITGYSRSELVISFDFYLRPYILYCDHKGYKKWFSGNSNTTNYEYGNLLKDSRVSSSSYGQYYTVGSRMKNFGRESFMKLWLDNAIGKQLNVFKIKTGYISFLSPSETVETLAISYDMSNV